MSQLGRHCAYCLANPYLGEQHLSGCPASTNVYPITDRDGDMSCMGPCHTDFKAGEFFTYVRNRSGELKVFCLGCAAQLIFIG